MKKAELIFTAVLGLCMVCLTGCHTDEETSPIPGASPAESVFGYITDEAGNPLEIIQIDAFLDEALIQSYSDGPKLPLDYSDKDGYYAFGQASEYGYYLARELPLVKDVYVVVSDTAGIYETQVQHIQMIYRKESGYVVSIKLDFQLMKSE